MTDSPADQYFDFHHMRANEGAPVAELNILMALANHYASQEYGRAYHRPMAAYGDTMLKLAGQAYKPN